MKTKQRIDARCSEWPWVQGATASTNFRFIRNISGDNGDLVAQVLYVEGDTDNQTKAYANAKLVQLAPEMAQALHLVHEVLAEHPEANKGNSKVHFAVLAAQALLNKMEH